MFLLIDDNRSLNCEIIARTAEAGKMLLKVIHKDIECLCIDHDLGSGENGCDVIKWAIVNKCLPKKVQIVSANPVGRQNIANALVFDGDYDTFNNIDFIKNQKILLA